MSKSNNNQPKLGFPVLIYLAPSAPLSLSFQLRIQYNTELKQASFMLGTVASAFLEGASDEHSFVAQYDADDLDSNTLNNNNKVQLQVPPTRLDEIKRDTGTPHVISFTLRLKRPCPLWCPRLDALVPAAGLSAEASFKELVQLSKATTVHIALNRKWLTDEHKHLLQIINSGSEALSGYPVARYYSKFFNQADWTVFRPESPISPPSTPPDYKRANLNKSPSSIPISSPTDVATSPSHSQIAGFLGLHPQGIQNENGPQIQAITSVVERHLPGLVQQFLPYVIEQTLPSLFALPNNFPSYTSNLDTPSPPNQNQMPHPLNLTPLGATLMPFIFDHLRPQVQQMISSSLNRGVNSRLEQALFHIGDRADENITDLHQAIESGIDDVLRERDGLMHKLRQEKEEAIKEMQLERDNGMYEVETKRDDGMMDLSQERNKGIDALQWEKEGVEDELHRVVSDALVELRGDADNTCESALSEADSRIWDRANEIVAGAHKDLEEIQKTTMRVMKGETILLRGQRPGRRAGKGGYWGLGHRQVSQSHLSLLKTWL
ncbi:hypothetical protein ST47_g8066 [Ascochyta rabiei]|uniref:Uncharacterized protein n=1 Tax=Didymella rabiei TaxID=5454 RepID=A0A162ZTH6_DIDRA|nr:hypothetical protein ST47_g8066 [Ascochyta rabiei]